MAELKKHGDLQINEDLEFQRKSWRIQRVGWGVMLLLAIFALAGLLGNGPASNARAGQPDGAIQVRYQRIVRLLTPIDMELEIKPAAGSDTVRVRLAGGFVNGLHVDTVRPEPESQALAPDADVYTFTVAQAGEPVRVRMRLEARRIGSNLGVVEMDGEEPLRLSIFVLP